MLQESAVVVAVSGATARVEIAPSSRCRGCGACSGGEGGPMVAEVQNPVGAGVGDRVEVCIPESKVLSAAAAAYLVPLFGLIAGVTLAYPVAGILGSAAEPTSIAGAAVGLVAGFLLVSRIDKRAAKSGSYTMTIASIRADDDDTTSEGRDAS